MEREQQSSNRPLELSDIVSEKHAAILADPYGFLGLPQDAPFDMVRGVFIGKAKLYHPDMIHPTLDSVADMDKRILESGFIIHDILGESELDPEAADEEKDSEMRKKFAAAAGVTVADLDNQAKALRAMQELAHTRMVELNTAYEAIRLKLNPRQREMIAGYIIRDMKEEDGLPYQEIDLEGQGQVDRVPTGRQDTDHKYVIPGSYLLYDWGPPRDHRWMDWEMGYSESDYVPHLFVHYELQEGREQITPALLKPFYETFGLDLSQREIFMKMLVERETSKDMLNALGLRQEIEISRDGGDLTPEWFRSLMFNKYVNGMMYLYQWGEPYWYQDDIPQMRIESGKLKLKAYSESVFSETDTILLQTMAYGPMLRQDSAA